MVITSKSNPLIKEIAALNEKKYRREKGLYLVEGIKPVKECISAGCNVKKIVCIEELDGQFEGAVLVSRSVFTSISSEKSPQGVIAVVELPTTSLNPPKNSCILLDCLQDPGNLGTIIRTANAAGYK
ncbi:MAG: RNA methyltransferase, partial [Clostridia bacterium]|nr:RNA methyltransferase [Clostridia bacterium]